MVASCAPDSSRRPRRTPNQLADGWTLSHRPAPGRSIMRTMLAPASPATHSPMPSGPAPRSRSGRIIVRTMSPNTRRTYATAPPTPRLAPRPAVRRRERCRLPGGHLHQTAQGADEGVRRPGSVGGALASRLRARKTPERVGLSRGRPGQRPGGGGVRSPAQTAVDDLGQRPADHPHVLGSTRTAPRARYPDLDAVASGRSRRTPPPRARRADGTSRTARAGHRAS